MTAPNRAEWVGVFEAVIRRSDLATARRSRWAALGGVIGPAAFVGAWSVSTVITSEPYSVIDDPISRLAAVSADTRPLMTTGFVVFGLGLGLYGWALRLAVGGAAWATAVATGVATLAVAAAPLDRSSTVDGWHGIFAGVGYVTLAATPLLAAPHLLRQGHRVLARVGIAAGAASAVCLALSSTSLPTGLFQRLGLTASDGWVVASALAIMTGALPTGSARTR